MNKVVTFGEIMLRLSPPNNLRMIQTSSFDASYGGAEANVAVSLANFGVDTEYVTKVPNNEIGQSSINELKKHGVGVSHISRGGDRLGIYYMETGVSQRPSKVIYDRLHSSISMANSMDFNWDNIFSNATWFHFTGITPALSSTTAEITLEACKKAKEKGCIVSCDINYRNKLWNKTSARLTISELCKYVDVCIANEEDAYNVFGIETPHSNLNEGNINPEDFQYTAKELAERYDFSAVAITMRESFSASNNGWSALLYKDKKMNISPKYYLNIVDRVGGGDSFAAGLIYGLINNMEDADTLKFATAASALKHSIRGDFNLMTEEEVKNLMNGNVSGRIQR